MKARHNDNVERLDSKYLFGRVTSIRKDGSFWVEWSDYVANPLNKKDKNFIKTIETGKTVALVRRVK
jgi:hypothetical protein